jgi:hypothetical protein
MKKQIDSTLTWMMLGGALIIAGVALALSPAPTSSR